MVAVIAHAKGAPNHRSDPVSGPHVAPEAVGFRSLGQQAWNLGALRGRQARCRAAAGLALQRVHPTLPAAPEPLAHRSLADPERDGNVFAPPAGFMQLPGPPAPPGPHICLCRRCAHTSQRSML
jgi:hypothetical protein